MPWKTFGDALGGLGDAGGGPGEPVGVLWGFPGAPGTSGSSSDKPTWANLGPTCGQHEPTWAILGPIWSQLGPNSGHLGTNMGQHGPTWGQHGPTRANWGQHGANMDRAKPEKTAFRLDGGTFFTKLGKPWEALGSPSEAPESLLGSSGGSRGRQGHPGVFRISQHGPTWGQLGTNMSQHGQS